MAIPSAEKNELISGDVGHCAHSIIGDIVRRQSGSTDNDGRSAVLAVPKKHGERV